MEYGMGGCVFLAGVLDLVCQFGSGNHGAMANTLADWINGRVDYFGSLAYDALS